MHYYLCFRIVFSFVFFSLCFPAFAWSKQVPLSTMAGQMIMVGFRGNDPSYEPVLFGPLLEDIREQRVGGVILFDRDAITKEPHRNIVSVEQVRQLVAMLQKQAEIPLFIAVDQEGGRVRRFKEEHGVALTPSPQVLGNEGAQATKEQARSLGKSLKAAGITVNFAPGLDVNRNPASPGIGALERSFSADPFLVAAHGKAFAEGMWENGIVSAYKHFPGHGSATGDTHYGMVDVTQTWHASELVPYKELLAQSVPAMVMAAHVINRDIDDKYPASLSHNSITGLLRQQLGWEGVVVTDDLQMQAVTKHYTLKEAVLLAVNAGADIVLYGNNLEYDPYIGRTVHTALMELVYEGKIAPETIQASYERIMALKRKLPL